MVVSILELIGAVVVWGAVLPLAQKAFSNDNLILGILWCLVLVVSATCGLTAGLSILGAILGNLFTILIIVGIFAVVWFVINLFTGKKTE